MKRDDPGKTRTFIKKALLLWLIAIGIFVLLKILIYNVGEVEVEESQSGLLTQLNGILFLFGVCGIPIIVLLSIALKFAQRAIDKMGNDKT